jgi:hypothetical protein
MATNVSTQTVVEPLSPPVATLFYYLVSRKNACAESIPGRDSHGNPIPNSAPCSALALEEDSPLSMGSEPSTVPAALTGTAATQALPVSAP